MSADLSLDHLIELRMPAAIERLVGYARRETPTGDARALVAFGEELAQRYRDLGCTVTLVASPGGCHVVASLPGTGTRASEGPVALIGHTDTVWPAGTLAGMPVELDGSVLRGPGTFDMKAGLVVIEEAMAILAETGAEHPPLLILLACDEEIGSPTFGELLRRSVVGAQCALGFESPHADGALKLGRRGSTRLRLTVTGRESHAALDPESGVSAIDELVDQLAATRIAVGEIAAAHGVPILCNVGTISGGTRANVVAGSAQAELGFRFVDEASETAMLARMATLVPRRAGARIACETLSQRPAWGGTERSAALLSSMAEAASRVGQSLDARPAAGAADTNLTGSLGIPTLDGLGPAGGGAHAAHEHVSLDSLRERILLLCSFLGRP